MPIFINDELVGICSPRHTGCFIDWLSLSFPPHAQIETLEPILQGLVLPRELEESGGGDGYKSSFRTQDRSIELLLNGGHEGMGPHLVVKGKACERLQDQLVVLVTNSVAAGAKVARLDLSVDEYAGILDLDEVQAALKAGLCVSKFRKEPRVEELYHPRTGEVIGKIIRFGSRTSKVCIRLYNKSMQQNEDYHWLRVEIELKKEVARQVAEDWLAGISLDELFFGVLSSYISFRQRSDDCNRSRWPVAPWWQLFLDQGPRASFRMRRDSPKDDLEWFVKNYDKVAARAARHYGPNIFQQMVESGSKKLAGDGSTI